MPRYRVQGPDGAVHVFEGPEGATPEQITAFASKTFGETQQPAAAKSTAADGIGAVKSAIIGAGRTGDQILDGLTQWLLQARGEDSALQGLKQNNEEKARLYKPLQEAHPIATAIGETLPSMAVPVGGGASLAGNLGRLAIAGAAPGAIEYGTAGERTGRAAAGAAGAAVGGVVIPKVASAVASAVPAIGRTARAVFEPLTEAGRTRIVGRTLNNAAGADATAAVGRLGTAAPLVPGSAPTVAQVAENGGLAALERAAASRNPADFTTRAMEQSGARIQALRGIAGDEGGRAFARAERAGTSGPIYQEAFAVDAATRMTPALQREMQTLMRSPGIKQAAQSARENAANAGRNVGPSNGSGSIEGLHNVKLALDDMIAQARGGNGSAALAVRERGLLDAQRRLVGFIEQLSPEYATARAVHADMSRPINQMDIGQHLLEQVEPALADFGALGKETAAKYALALRNGDRTAKAATGRDMPLASIMDPQQMATLQAVAADLARKTNAQDLGRGPGSNTFQNLAMDNIAAQSGAPRVMGAAMNLPGVSKLAKFMYSGPEEQIQTALAQALLDPAFAAQVMRTNPARPAGQSARQLLLGSPSRATQIAGGATGLGLMNLFAQ